MVAVPQHKYAYLHGVRSLTDEMVVYMSEPFEINRCSYEMFWAFRDLSTPWQHGVVFKKHYCTLPPIIQCTSTRKHFDWKKSAAALKQGCLARDKTPR